MGFEVREALRKLCVEAGWSYAVFWRVVDCGEQIHLVWEDGYCERSIGTSAMSGFEAMDKLLRRKASRSSRECQVAQLSCVAEDKMVTLVNEMMASEVHVVGDGIVGKAASTGTHQWLFLDDISDYGFMPKVVAQMKHQLLAGIQTIVVIPILPHGAVQLGSGKMVMEDFGFINYVNNLFAQILCVLENSVVDITKNCFNQKIQVLGPVGTSIGHSVDVVSDWNKLMEDKQQRNLCYDSFSVATGPCHSVGTRIPCSVPSLDCSFTKQLNSRMQSPRTVNYGNREECKDLKIREITNNQKIRSIHNAVPQDFCEHKQSNSLTYLEEQLSSMSCNVQEISGTEELALYAMKNVGSESKYPNVDLFDNLYNNSVSPGFLDDTVLRYMELNGNELCESTSNCIYQQDDSSIGAYSAGIFAEAKPEQGDLLDAVVSNINFRCSQNVNNCIDYRTSETTVASYASSSCTDNLLPSLKDSHGGFPGVSSPIPKAELEGLGILINSTDKTEVCYETKLGQRCEMTNVTENDLDVTCDVVATGPLNSTHEVSKFPRKRSRLGENPRPKPKDRQLMQDYIRELRGIVPDGVKCSIDSLLEKTIKHMLFLQSVTKYADELKGTAEPRLMTEDDSLPLQDKFEGGATWAFEVGSKSMVCPIIVEDLNSPRQMLVEMLCEERGLFLEIADLIRGLGLTILKGVMEARNSKVWARFTVEANRDVTRMDVFLSLVHLLDATMGNVSKEQVSNLCSMSHMSNPSSLLDCLQ